MRLLWAHDVRFVKHGNEYFTTGSLTNEVLKRYVTAFGEVTALGRVIEQQEPLLGLTKIDEPGVTILGVERGREGIAEIWRQVLAADAVIARVPSLFGNTAAEAARHLDRKLLVEVVGCAWDSFRYHSRKGRLVAPFAFLHTRRVVRDADFAVYVTEEFLQRRYPTRGVSKACSDVTLSQQPDDLARRLGLTTEISRPLVMGTLGAVNVAYKGQADVIRALGEMRRHGTQAVYYVAGPGSPDRLKSIAAREGVADSVVFLGSIDHQKVPGFFRSLDIYVQPSLTEGMPRSLLEAMSFALPTVSTDVGGMPEVVRRTRTYHPGDHKRLAGIIIDMCQGGLTIDILKNFLTAQRFAPEALDQVRGDTLQNFADQVNQTSL